MGAYPLCQDSCRIADRVMSAIGWTMQGVSKAMQSQFVLSEWHSLHRTPPRPRGPRGPRGPRVKTVDALAMQMTIGSWHKIVGSRNQKPKSDA